MGNFNNVNNTTSCDCPFDGHVARCSQSRVGARPVAVVGLMLSSPVELYAIARKHDAHDFGLPGGKVDRGETIHAALCRELHEELGIVVRDAELIFSAPTRVHYTYAFHVHAWDGEPVSMEGPPLRRLPYAALLSTSCTYREFNLQLFQSLKWAVNVG